MSVRRPAPWMYTALQLSLAGAEPDAIASKLGKRVSLVKALLASEWAQTSLSDWHAAVMAATLKDRIDPIRQFQSLVDKAIAKVDAKMDCGDDKVELAAACRVLDNAGLSVVKRIEVSEDERLRDLTMAEMEQLRVTGRIPERAALRIQGAVHGAED